ncbi:MAG: hypothetical protein L0L22_14460 [Staphylococcus equorum]|nr:hypothetical protein [Tetragenococcus koreensis]MDN6572187.1 hypothetical protein [Staphylococcus equorum]MDN6166356.1 hypothetical protein [Tetragenococcus koreensis]MDN6269862.1 hypothetical protein [Tetragenococcus koreensis]MDN6496704.1 hypothetical protein [Tetragenococcus koreensis]
MKKIYKNICLGIGALLFLLSITACGQQSIEETLQSQSWDIVNQGETDTVEFKNENMILGTGNLKKNYKYNIKENENSAYLTLQRTSPRDIEIKKQYKVNETDEGFNFEEQKATEEEDIITGDFELIPKD